MATIVTANGRPKADRDEIRKALGVLFEPGDVIELRAPKAGRLRTASGYFDDLDELTAAAVEVNAEAPGVYITLNPVEPALLSRRCNRWAGYAAETTTDNQVPRRRWLLIDTDPRRPAGISATDEEHAEAIALTRQIWQHLVAELGWPEPVAADSGNGGHLLFRVDLPAEDGGLIGKVLRALDLRFSDERVTVDTSVHNPARIVKVYGTVAGKGDHTHDRPHRLARLLHVPAIIEPVPEPALRHLADLVDEPATNSSPPARGPAEPFDVDRWLLDHQVPAGQPRDYCGAGGRGRRWTFDTCPWNPDHTGGTAYLIQFDSGKLAAGCLHASCPGKSWHDLRELYQPGYRDRRHPDVGNGNRRPPTPPAAPAAADRPTIVTGTDESRVINEAIDALAAAGQVYQRTGSLAHIVRNAPPPRGVERAKDAPRIAELKPARLQELLADAAYWMRPAGNDSVEPCHPPGWTVKAVEARGEWPTIPPIEGVVEAPVIRADGSVIQAVGYDEATGLLYQPSAAFPPIPSSPTQDDARNAAEQLLEVIEDFPFADTFHRAAWLSAVLTPLARFAFHGPTPLHLIDANTRGSGKGLLSDTVGLIVQGRPTPRMTAPTDDDEFRKRITALAISAEPLILIDNIGGALGGPALDAALTATTWSDRVLGKTEMISSVPLTAVWMATGNNVQLFADTARRTLHIRLESPEERPEERQNFHHPHLLDWVKTSRPRLVAAALTILSSYCSAGRPNMGLKPWGSFEAWSGLVRSAITWAGLDDPGETRKELNASADTEANALRRLLDGWRRIDPESLGMTVASVLGAIEELGRGPATMPSEYQTVRDAISELVPTQGGRLPSARSVGMKFNRFRRRVVGGQCLDRRDGREGNYWYIKQTGANG